MSAEPISRSEDLKRLRDEGYEVEVRDGYLLIGSVPYVNPEGTVKYGTLVSELTLAGDVTVRPDDHTMRFAGETPCNQHGHALSKILIGSAHQQLTTGIEVDHHFSSKPPEGYADYYEKAIAYIRILSGPAQALDAEATAQTFRVIEETEDGSVFNYLDTASSRAGISALTEKLRDDKIAIAGLGGSGSYVLDLVAKTPVGQIHLFDGDVFLQHNAFRAPGAASIERLREKPSKVAYFQSAYSKMRKGIVVHEEYIDASNVELLREMDFVFLAMDDGEAKKPVVEKLQEWGTSFVDVGIGVFEANGLLGGQIRVTTSTPSRPVTNGRIPMGDPDPDNLYGQNIQIAELNALSAALAVIKWKKQVGFYLDLENEHSSIYQIDGNSLLNEDQA
jgi:ThiF family